jgi:hypothetical protein
MKSISCIEEKIRFTDIPTPEIFALVVANGSGSKVFQSFLDSHEQIYMIPAYPLLYFYPHWKKWETDLKDTWHWEALIDIFCIKHASVLDSRNIPGFNGLMSVGKNKDEYLSINEKMFRSLLLGFLTDQPIHRRTFLLAIHYSFALCMDEDISKKKVLVFHVHGIDYLIDYLHKDFSDVKTFAMIRDPRSNFERRVLALTKIDSFKLNSTDAIIFRKRAVSNMIFLMEQHSHAFSVLDSDSVFCVKHEDLYLRLGDTMKAVAETMGIDFNPNLLEITFGGKMWWGDKNIYSMKLMNHVNPGVVSEDWKGQLNSIDWFVLEGLFYDFLVQYQYPLFKYMSDSIWNRILLILAVTIPTRIERQCFFSSLKPSKHREFIKACIDNSTGKTHLKDYSWNATYLYKWTYLDLKLWLRPWYVSLLFFGEKASKSGDWWPFGKLVYYLSRYLFIGANYGRFLWSIWTFPGVIVTRWSLSYVAIFRRFRKRNYHPKMLG